MERALLQTWAILCETHGASPGRQNATKSNFVKMMRLQGIDMIHSLNPHQLEATAGGDTLRAHSVAMAGNKVIGQSEQHRNAKRLLAALQKVFSPSSLC